MGRIITAKFVPIRQTSADSGTYDSVPDSAELCWFHDDVGYRNMSRFGECVRNGPEQFDYNKSCLSYLNNVLSVIYVYATEIISTFGSLVLELCPLSPNA